MRRDLLLAPAALCAWLGAFVLGSSPTEVVATWGLPVVAVLAAITLALLLIALVSRQAVIALVAVAVAAGALGAFALVARAEVMHPPAVATAVDSGAVVAATATVDSGWRAVRAGGPSWQGGSFWFDATLRSVDGTAVAAPARVFVSGDATAVDVGAVVAFDARLRASEDSVAEAVLADAMDDPRIQSGADGFDAVAGGLRHGFLEHSAALHGDPAGLLPGLAIGDTSRLDPGLEEAMRTASLTHLTAVSGANCAVVVAAALLIAAAFGAGPVLRTATALLVLGGFVVLVTPEPSVVRAAVMAAVVLLARLLGRDGAPAAALWLAVVVLIVLDPAIATRLGFVLSVLATAGLLLLAEPIARRLSAFLPFPLAVIVAVPLAAQLACQPVIVLVDPSIPVYGVLANLLAEPAAPLATGLGLIGCLLVPLWPWAADIVIAVAAVPAWWIASVARAAASWPSPRLPWLPGVLGAAVLAVLTFAVVLLFTTPARWSPLRRVSAGVVVLAIVIGGASTVATPLLRAAALPSDWRVLACDIGQGDAVLWRSAAGVGLVDVGPDPALLRTCLDRARVDRIRFLVLTHYDLDHIGGLDAVIGRVDTALVGPTDGLADEGLVQDLRTGGAEVRRAARGDAGVLGAVRWRIDWPERTSSLVGNPASLVLRIDAAPDAIGGALSAMFLGDLGAEEQGRLARLPGLGTVDVVKVAHHGSTDQDPRLYAELGAAVGLVSVGADNDYGHPGARTIEMLEGLGISADRTDLQGAIAVSSRAEGLIVWSEHAGSDAIGLTAANGGSDGRQSTRAGRDEDVGEGRDPAIALGSGAAGVHRADHRAREVPGGTVDAIPPRLPARRGSEPRGARHLRRRVRAGGAAHPRQPVALRRAAVDPRDERREVHRRLPAGGARLPRATRREHDARPPPRRGSARQETARRDPWRAR
ncbi:ComEC/Rec2 family competence protein [Microbacteriaceae bacterium VKM Ac-2855]|nr:ComEC/Rec2 family competence protein [Microbacteriaceae bacterium VKM Ac-2855]